ncbi:MAG: arsenate reductase [Halieaceae bacterium]|jgi:arsenate reductase|nr:arsenate reductase [Halieaceae bacterium]
MSTTLYGIPNCDTVRKARKWFDAQGIDYDFVDFRETPVSEARIKDWLTQAGAPLLNKRSTTWKQLDEDARIAAEAGDVVPLLLANPTLIKRPVLEHNGRVTVGFKAEDYATTFGV